MTIKRSPAITSDHRARYERISKADLVEAFRDFARDVGGFGETDESQWFAELERRVEIVRTQRKAGNSMLHVEQPATDEWQQLKAQLTPPTIDHRKPYPDNTITWNTGDLVIHKADAKRHDMLMRVVGYTRDGLCKTKYAFPSGNMIKTSQAKIWTNPISELLDPALFGIDTKGGNDDR